MGIWKGCLTFGAKKLLQSAPMNLLRRYLASVLFPARCAGCGQLTESPRTDVSNPVICKGCLDSLERTEQFALRDNLTEDLFAQNKQFGRAASFCFYDKHDTVSSLIQKAKYGRQPEINLCLARLAALDGLQSDFFDDMDVIIPVPLHPRRFRQRGYNQSDYIAQGLSEILRIPIDTTHITRVRNNPQQARTKGKERERNVEGVFAVNHPEEMYRRHILLVDDVITTGSTILSCMDAMSAFRGARISVFALAKAR